VTQTDLFVCRAAKSLVFPTKTTQIRSILYAAALETFEIATQIDSFVAQRTDQRYQLKE
jgi:hypothetical protein